MASLRSLSRVKPTVAPSKLWIGGRGRAVEAFLPIGELAGELFAGEPAALPHREVGVGDGELGEIRVASFEAGRVELGELARQDAEAPAVGHDVVHAGDEDVASLFEAG
jgi:hypothetical protein